MVGVKNKSKRARQSLFQYPEGGIIDGLYVVGNMAQVIANKRKIGLFGLNIPYPANGFNGLMIGDITSQPVYGVRRVNDQSAFSQHLNHLFNGSRIGVFRIYLYKHSTISDFACGRQAKSEINLF